MSVQTLPIQRPRIEYPESDGQPMADNTLQFHWITTLQGGLDSLFRNDPDVFVAGDLFWYPIEGDNKTRAAPDTMVVFGRPKGHRGSYRQWEEDDIAPQVVFEVLSPSNRPGRLAEKFQFYEQFGIEEYYVFDPDRVRLSGWLREDDILQPIEELDGWTSPLLGIRFELSSGDLRIFHPNGNRFFSYLELFEQSEADRRRADAAQRRAEQERRRAEIAQRRAEIAQRRAEEERQRAEIAQQRVEQEQRRAERLAARLRELGLDPDE